MSRPARGLVTGCSGSGLPRWRGERRGHDRLTRAEQVDQHGADIETTNARSVDHTRQDLLGGDTAWRTISARDFAIDHGWPQGLFSASVGRVDSRIEEKSEDGRQFDGQMRGEALQRRRAHRLIDQVGEVVEEPAARDRGAMARDVTRRSAVAHGERLLQDGMVPLGPRGARLIGRELAAAAQRQTSLMRRVLEPPIGRPANHAPARP